MDRSGARDAWANARMRSTAGGLHHTRPAAVIAAAIAALLLLSLGASSASALIKRLPNGHRVSYAPTHRPLALTPLTGSAVRSAKTGAPLEYHGGPIMTSNTNYTFYWSPSGAAGYPAGYTAGIDRYLEGLAADSGTKQNVDSVSAQYTNGAGEAAAYNSHFAGAIIDTNPYPENGCSAAAICLTDAQIQAELTSYISAHGLPADLTHEYFVLTPPAVESCFEASGFECSSGSSSPAYCAYHGKITVGGGVIVYADDPYTAGVLGCDTNQHPSESIAEGTIQGGLSHEHNESITDPELSAWYGPEGSENGDKCRTFIESTEYGKALGTAPDGAPYNQVVGGVDYWYQQEWSNRTVNCQQRLAPAVPMITRLKPKSGAAAGGSIVTIIGAGFTGASSVRFGATAAVSFTVNSDTSITASAPAGTTGAADVTVTGEGGTSPLVAGDRFTYGPPTITSISPATGPVAGGTAVTITGSGFAVGATTVFSFGKAHATSVSCSSSTHCTATTPAYASPHAIDVKATVASRTSRNNPAGDRFTYK